MLIWPSLAATTRIRTTTEAMNWQNASLKESKQISSRLPNTSIPYPGFTQSTPTKSKASKFPPSRNADGHPGPTENRVGRVIRGRTPFRLQPRLTHSRGLALSFGLSIGAGFLPNLCARVLFQFPRIGVEATNTFAQFLHCHRIFIVHPAEGFLIQM